MSLRNISDTTATTIGIGGTVGAWTLTGTLQLVVTLCTLIVVGPKAWAQLVAWYHRLRRR